MSQTTAIDSGIGTRGFLSFRQLQRYPSNGVRYTSLAVVVLSTVVLYYQLYLSGGVAVDILKDYGITFKWFVLLNVAALAIAAVAAHFGGLADRFGRANIISVGLAVVGILCVAAVPNCDGKWSFAVVFCAINAVEGVILVATPAMVRDFSPQLGRATAMAFWTMGPVIGSLVVTSVVGSGTSSWKHEYTVAGICGLVVAVLSVPLLRELSPGLRDQVMVAQKDRALIEARVAGIDVTAAQRHPARQMIKPDIVLASVAISVFLLFYISMVAFGPTYLQVNFGYSQTRANNVLIWAWATNVAGLVLAGFVSDKLLVRKPFMVLGSVVAVIGLIFFIGKATDASTSYTTFAVLFSVIFFFSGIAYVCWMAAFTETVERRNPALTATGLAAWGLIIRFFFAAIILVAPYVVTTVNTLVDHGSEVQMIAAGHSPDLTASQNAAVVAIAKDPSIATRVEQTATTDAAQLKTAQEIDPATQRTLLTDPTNDAALAKAVGDIVEAEHITSAAAQAKLFALAQVPTSDLLLVEQYGPALQSPRVQSALTYLQTYGADVQKAGLDGPKQWQKYYWITAAGMIVFLPMIWLMAGYWRPSRARKALREHEQAVAAELAGSRGSDGRAAR